MHLNNQIVDKPLFDTNNEKKQKIFRKNGTIFELKSINAYKSYLDIKGIDSNWDNNEIIEILQEVGNR